MLFLQLYFINLLPQIFAYLLNKFLYLLNPHEIQKYQYNLVCFIKKNQLFKELLQFSFSKLRFLLFIHLILNLRLFNQDLVVNIFSNVQKLIYIALDNLNLFKLSILFFRNFNQAKYLFHSIFQYFLFHLYLIQHCLNCLIYYFLSEVFIDKFLIFKI